MALSDVNFYPLVLKSDRPDDGLMNKLMNNFREHLYEYIFNFSNSQKNEACLK
jgi:hypothetical protein